MTWHNVSNVGYSHESYKKLYDKQLLTSQNSLMNCLHMPQGLAGGLIFVDTAMALKSPLLQPW